MNMADEKKLVPDKYEGLSIFRPPLCYELTGKTFELVMDDGYDKKLEFVDDETLVFGGSSEEKRYRYDCLKMDDQCYFVNFEERPFRNPRLGITLILDLRESLVTAAYATLGKDPKFPKMPAAEIVFGAIVRADGTIPAKRHSFTAEMAGTSIDWNYGSFNIAHVYWSERYYRVAFTPRALERIRKNNPQMMAGGGDQKKYEAPKEAYEDYMDTVKIRDGLYAVSLLETNLCRRNGHGNSLFFLMNLKEMHDVGRSFGTNGDGEDENYTFGAFGAWFDAKEVREMPGMYYIH
jgi:hypothetical protein